jgi:2-polyprenyl-3-methyl-5-hydroxy-6-metoxy-1,4-benzoquinol methylase
MQELHPCIFCGSRHYRLLFAVGEYTVQRCLQCGLVQTHPLPVAGSMDVLYDDEYFARLVQRKEQELFYHRRILDLVQAYETSGRMLEVGIGAGLFMELTLGNGWEIQGVEPSEAACRYVTRTVGAPVHHGTLESAHFPPNSFDVIMLRHVLEHVAEPQKFMRELRRILKDNGLICLVVPNLAGCMPEWRKSAGFISLFRIMWPIILNVR